MDRVRALPKACPIGPACPLDASPLPIAWAGSLSCLVDGVYWTLLAWILHLPPSAVSLAGDVRFRRSA
jgi:hypothetical protein